jgi:hypothetical protein
MCATRLDLATHSPLALICRHTSHHVLCAPVTEQHSSPAACQAQIACQTFVLLLDPATWPSGGGSATPVAGIASYLGAHSAYALVAALLACALPAPRCATRGPCAAEDVACALCRSASDTSMVSGVSQQAWALLCVPDIWQRTTSLQRLVPSLAALMLHSLSIPIAELQVQLAQQAGDLGLQAANEPLAASVAFAALTLLSNLLQLLRAPRPASLSSPQALSFLRSSQALMALAPPSAREAVVHDSVRALASGDTCTFSVLRAACRHPASQQAAGPSGDDVFSGAAWYLPSVPALDASAVAREKRHRHVAGSHSSQQRRAEGSAEQAMDVDGPRHSAARGVESRAEAGRSLPAADAVHFRASLASPHLLLQLASATLEQGVGSAGESAELLLRPATSLALWLFMLLALSSSDDVVRQQLETSLTASALGLVRLLWSRVLRPAMARAPLGKWGEGALTGVGMEVLLLAVLCSLYAHFVSTASDDTLFSDQVRHAAALPCMQLPAHFTGWNDALQSLLCAVPHDT